MSDAPVPTPAPTPTPVEETRTTTVTSEKKSSNTGLKVILIVAAVLLCLCVICSVAGYLVYQSTLNASQGLLNAISNEFQNEINNDLFNTNPDTDEVDPNDTPEEDFSNDSYSYDGTLPSGFPTDVPAPSDAKVLYSGTTTQNGKPTYAVTLTTGASISELKNFYETGLVAQGWTIVESQNYENAGLFITANKNGREMTVIVSGEVADDFRSIVIAVQ